MFSKVNYLLPTTTLGPKRPSHVRPAASDHVSAPAPVPTNSVSSLRRGRLNTASPTWEPSSFPIIDPYPPPTIPPEPQSVASKARA